MTTTIENLDQLVEDCSKQNFNHDTTLHARLVEAVKLHGDKLLESYNNEQRDKDNIASNEDRPEFINDSTHNKKAYRTLEDEIEEALMNICANPHNLANYISAAKLYSCQGNQKDAVHICEQGLKNGNSTVTSSSSPLLTSDHILLQQQLDIIRSKLGRGIDFFKLCPHEVSLHIISYFDSATAFQCVDVSRTWRYKFLDYASIWEKFVLDGVGKQRRIAQLLKIESKHIKTLTIRALPDKINRHLNVSIKKNDFSSLQSLKIIDTGDGIIDPNVNLNKSLFNALQSVAKILTRLELGSQSAFHISLGRILLTCRNMIHLKLGVYSLDDGSASIQLLQNARSSSPSDFKVSPLKYLDLFANCTLAPLIIRDVLREVVKFTPELRHLILSYEAQYTFDAEDIINVIRDFCPKLKVIKTSIMSGVNMDVHDRILNIGDYGEEDDADNGDDNEELIEAGTVLVEDQDTDNSGLGFGLIVENGSMTPMEGMRHLEIHNLGGQVQSLYRRLVASRQTLETLSLRLGISALNSSFPQYWDGMNSAIRSMPHLKAFRLSKMGPYVFEALGNTIQCFPALETLILEDSMVSDDFDLYDANIRLLNAIIRSTNIKRLELDTMQVLRREFFEQLMDYYYTVSTTSSTTTVALKGLEVLKIVKCKKLSYKALLFIPRITSLKELSIGYQRHQGIYSNLFTELFTNYLVFDPTRPQELSKLELLDMKFTNQALHNIIVLCKRNEMLQKKLVLKNITGCSPDVVRLFKKELTELYNSSNDSEIVLLPCTVKDDSEVPRKKCGCSYSHS